MNAIAQSRPLSSTERTRVRRLPERARTEREDLYAVLDAGKICHLGVIIDGSPVVLPTGYGRLGDTLYLHGSSGNRAIRAAAGQDVCVTVTLLDGLVCARSVFHHSMNYRSAMVFGTARMVTDDAEQLDGLQAVTEQLIPGRWAVARPPTKKELAKTSVLALPLAEASVKVRNGPPADDEEDLALPVWAGVVPAALTFGPPQADALLDPAMAVPAHVSALTGHDSRSGRPGRLSAMP